MLDNVLIPQQAILAYAHGLDQPRRLKEVIGGPLFPFREAAEILDMTPDELREIVEEGRIFALETKRRKA